MDRRSVLRGVVLLSSAGSLLAQENKTPGREEKRLVDPAPLENELDKYPKCSQCGMDRARFHRTRHLIHYADDTAEGSCSIRCVAVSLVNSLRKETRAIYAADFGAEAEPRPLIDVEKVTYIIGGDFPTVMSKRPKTAFASLEAARAGQAAKGGELADYDQTLTAAFADLVEGLKLRRQRRAEREARQRLQTGKTEAS